MANHYSGKVDPDIDPDFKPRRELPPKQKLRRLASDFGSVVKRLEKYLRLIDRITHLDKKNRSKREDVRHTGGILNHYNAVLQESNIRLPEMDEFFDLYTERFDPSSIIPDVAKGLKIETLSDRVELLIGNPFFQKDLSNYNQWLIKEMKRFVRETLPSKLDHYVSELRTEIYEASNLSDFIKKASIAVQLEDPVMPLCQRLEDFPERFPKYELNYSRRGDSHQRGDEREGGDPDLGLHRDRIPEEKIFNQALEYAVEHYGEQFKNLPLPDSGRKLLLSYHPISALIYNSENLYDSFVDALDDNTPNRDQSVMTIIGEAFRQLYEALKEYKIVVAGENDSIPWKNLHPLLRSFVASFLPPDSSLARYSLRIISIEIKKYETNSEMYFDIGLAIGVVTLIAGVTFLTAGTATPGAIVVIQALGYLSIVADMVGFTYQYIEEEQTDLFNRLSLIDNTLEGFPEGALGVDLFAYFALLYAGHILFRVGAKALNKVKIHQDIQGKAGLVLQELKTRHISNLDVPMDPEISAIESRMTSVSNRSVAKPREAGKSYSTNRSTLVEEGLEPASRVPKKDIQRLTKEAEKLREQLDPEIVRIANHLDANLTVLKQEAKRLGIDVEIFILDTLNYKIEAIRKFVSVRRELIRIQSELEDASELLRALKKRKSKLPEDVAEGERLKSLINYLGREKANAQKWWEAAKLTRTNPAMGDWHEFWLYQNIPHYLAPRVRNQAAYDLIDRITKNYISAKAIHVDEIAALSLLESPDFAINHGKSVLDGAAAKFFKNFDLAQVQNSKNFKNLSMKKVSFEDAGKVFEIAFICNEPPPIIAKQIRDALSEHVHKLGVKYETTYQLQLRFIPYRELLGLNSDEALKQLRGLSWPKGIIPVSAKATNELTSEN